MVIFVVNFKRATYKVVEFLDDGNEIEVVPSCWVKDRNKCFWPTKWKQQSKIAMAIKQQAPPDKNFEEFEVKVLYETDSFIRAREKLREAENTSASDLQTDRDVENSPQKRKKRQNQRYVNSSEDENEDKRKNKRPVKRIQSSESESSPEKQRTPTKRSRFIPEKQRTPTKKARHIPPPMPDLPRTPCQPSTSRQTSSISRPTLFGGGSSAASPISSVSATEKKILEMLCEVKANMKHMAKDISIIKKKIDTSANVVSDDLPGDMLLPIKDQQQIEDMENKLEDDSCREHLISYLGRIGGDNVGDCVRRVLNAVMVTDVAVTLNWKGKGDKKSFESLRLCGVIKSAVRKNQMTKNETDDKIETVIKKWLKYASDRNGGRKIREEKKKERERNQVEEVEQT